MLTCFLTLGLYLPGCQAPPQDLDRTLQVVSLRPLASTRMPPVSIPFGTLITQRVEPLLLLGAQDEDAVSVPGDAMVEFLQWLHPEEMDQDQLRANVHGHNLVLSGQREAVDAAARDIARITAMATSPIQVEGTLVEWSGDAPPPTVLGPQQLAELLRTNRAIWRQRTFVRSGDLTFLGSASRVPYVRDANVEIAQGSFAVVPVVDHLFDGVAVGAQVHRLVGTGEILLFGQFAVGAQRRGIRPAMTGNVDIPALDVPELDSAFGVASGRIQNGGALAITLAGQAQAGKGRVLLLSAQATAPGEGTKVGNAMLLPVSGLTTPALTFETGTPPSSHSFADDSKLFWFEQEQDPEQCWGRVDTDVLTELLRQALGDAFDETGNLVVYRGHLAVTGLPEHLAIAEQVLTALQDRWLQNGSLRATVAFGDGNGALHDVSLPMLRGRPHVLWSGSETTVLAEFGAEVAQDSKIHDPYTALVQRGLWLQARIDPEGTDANTACTAMLRHAGPPRRRSLDPAKIGELDLVERSLTSWNFEGPMAVDQPVDLGDGPEVDADGRRSTHFLLRRTR